MNCSSLSELLNVLQSRNEKIYVWGAGFYGNLLGKYLNRTGVSWEGYYDTYSSIGINGKPVIKEEVNKKNGLLILSMRNYKELFEQLVKSGIKESNIIFFSHHDFFKELESINEYEQTECERLKSFCDKYKGKRCFVIGNGPSLSENDLRKIEENREYSFACNYIFKCFDDVSWRPSFYCVSDFEAIKRNFEKSTDKNSFFEQVPYIFMRFEEKSYKNNKQHENAFFFNQVYSENEDVFDFSEDCSNKIVIGYSISYIMLQLALYMGFSEVILLGFDHSFSREIRQDGSVVEKKIEDHSDILKTSNVSYFMIDKVENAYRAAKEHAERRGIRIINATRGGHLEVFDRADFDSLFG